MRTIKTCVYAVLIRAVAGAYMLRESSVVKHINTKPVGSARELQGHFVIAERQLQEAQQQQEQAQHHDQEVSVLFGLELNTTKNGFINMRAIGDLLSTELHTYLWEELPNRYQLKEILIDDIQSISSEPVRTLRTLKNEEVKGVMTYEYVVTAVAEFVTGDIPSQKALSELLMAIQLPASAFEGSPNPILRSTVKAKLFPLHTSANALIASENEPVEPSALMEYIAFILLGAGFAMLTSLVAVSYYTMTSKKRKSREVISQSPESLEVVESDSKNEELPGDSSLARHGVLFVHSASASCSDDSLVEERGLNVETFSMDIPNDLFSCGRQVPTSPKRRRQWDIDSVICDSDSEVSGRRSKQNYRLKARIANEVIDNGMSCGIGSLVTQIAHPDIDIIDASDSDQDEGRNARGDTNIELVPRIQKDPITSRRVYQPSGQRYEKPRPRNDDIFTVVTDEEDEREGCVLVDPRQFVEDVVDEVIEEGYDCGMSLAGY